eukprot:751192-Hanusia_phi.AAC.1
MGRTCCRRDDLGETDPARRPGIQSKHRRDARRCVLVHVQRRGCGQRIACVGKQERAPRQGRCLESAEETKAQGQAMMRGSGGTWGVIAESALSMGTERLVAE